MNRKEKRQARIITLQTIYANEVSGVDIDAMLVHIAHDLNLDNNHSIILYSAELSKLTIKNKIEIDKIIMSHSKNEERQARAQGPSPGYWLGPWALGYIGGYILRERKIKISMFLWHPGEPGGI